RCNTCFQLKEQMEKANCQVTRKRIQQNHLRHIALTRQERAEYAKAKQKACSNPDKYMCIILDGMDQKKTRIPFFRRPPKVIASLPQLKTKLLCAMVHGFGNFFYWVTDQVSADTNLNIEALRRVFLHYQETRGSLPPGLYLQLDSARDNKSKLLFAFLSYLVQTGMFRKVKVSYLLVGHTHEADVDQIFSCISRYIRKNIERILTYEEFENAVKSV
ncbi:unnamed protein product, partial [Heterosigma akashiwo]